MSWLARSIANTLRLDDDGEEVVDLNDASAKCPPNDAELNPSSRFHHPTSESLDLEDVDSDYYNRISEKDTNGDDDDDDGVGADHNNQGRGVKEDLSEFTETLTRQLWGVASFLAPPQPPPLPPRLGTGTWEMDRRREEVVECSGYGDEESYDGEDGQFQEFPHSFLQIGMPEPEEVAEFEDAVGITEEALDFAENTAHHPETWLNFPLSEEEEFEHFEISESQYKHARAIEHLAPRLAALRGELCPVHMTEGYFWMVYFVLLHSRLSKHDNDLLSTPQLVKARAKWMEELQKQTKPEESDWFGRRNFHADENICLPYENLDPSSFEDIQPEYASQMAFHVESSSSQVMTHSEAEKHPQENHEIQFIEKPVLEEDPTSQAGKETLSSSSFKMPIEEYDEHEDDWLDDDSDLEGYVGTGSAFIDEEDVSFSDLEDDTDCNMPVKSKVTAKAA